jgi:hypothetical protein
MNDEIGAAFFDPAGERLPIAVEMWFAGAEMGIGDLDDLHGASPKFGIEAP